MEVQRSQLYSESLSQHFSLKIRGWKLLALFIPSQYTVLKYHRDSLALYGRTVSSVPDYSCHDSLRNGSC